MFEFNILKNYNSCIKKKLKEDICIVNSLNTAGRPITGIDYNNLQYNLIYFIEHQNWQFMINYYNILLVTQYEAQNRY